MVRTLLDDEVLLHLNTFVACQPPRQEQLDIGYLVSQTADNQISVFERAEELWHKSMVRFLGILLCGDGYGYPGFRVWQQELTMRYNIPKYAIVRVEIPGEENANTLSEMQAFIHTARMYGFETGYITAAPFHQLRAYITAVSVLSKDYPEFCLYNRTGGFLALGEEVAHSQGTLRATRRELRLVHEYERILKYTEKGDLLSAELVIAYYERVNKLYM